MAEINDPLPPEIKAELLELRAALDKDIPPKALDYNLLIATWNIRAFGGLTNKWKSGANDTPKRDLHALRCIAEIVSHFDVIALQEVQANLKALRHMLKVLGPNWGFILTDVTKGDPGNGERIAFLFDTRKVKLSGLACELVVPQAQLDKIAPDALEKQFARTPYAVSFRSGEENLHPGHAACSLWEKGREANPRAQGNRRMACRVGKGHPCMGSQPDRPRRLQHRPKRRCALQGLHLDRPVDSGRFKQSPSIDL